MAFLHGAVQHDVFLGIGQVLVGHVGAHAHFAGHLRHERPHEVAPRGHGALFQGEVGVGDERGLVDVAHHPGAAAGGAGASAVEGEVFGGGAVEFHAAGGAGDGQLGRHIQGRRVHVPVGAYVTAKAREHEAQVVQKLCGRAEGGVHPGDAGPLAQGESRRNVQHLVHGGTSGLGNTPARVGGKRLQVAATALGVQHAQRERAFARTGHARDAHELPQRHVQAEVLQVVHPRPAHLDGGRLGEGKRRGGVDGHRMLLKISGLFSTQFSPSFYRCLGIWYIAAVAHGFGSTSYARLQPCLVFWPGLPSTVPLHSFRTRSRCRGAACGSRRCAGVRARSPPRHECRRCFSTSAPACPVDRFRHGSRSGTCPCPCAEHGRNGIT